jgi:hypothetical protein
MKGQMKRTIPPIVAIAVLALVLAGCGGGKAKEGTLTTDDLASVIGPAPDTPAGASYADTGSATDISPAELRGHATTASDRTTVARLEKAGLLRLYQRSFDGGSNVADGTAYLFRTATGAGTAYLDLQTSLKRQAAPRKLEDASASGIGDEAWGAHLTGSSESSLFLFRTSNVIVVADMSCDTSCGLDIVSATRAYAREIADRVSQAAASKAS